MTSKGPRAQEAPLKVCDWDRCFENSRTRQIDALSWVRLPVQADSMGYLRFVDVASTKPEARLAMFGAWTALVKVAARCKPRGVLVRDRVVPLSAADIALKSSMGADAAPLFEEMMKRAKAIGWLTPLTSEECDLLAKGLPLEDNSSADEVDEPGQVASENATQPSPGRQVGVSRASPGRQVGVSQVTPEHPSVSGNGKLTQEEFDSIWGLFPQERRMDRGKCFDLCAAHVKAGRKFEALRDATLRYAQAVKAAETPPKFIQLAKTFFGAQGRVLDAMEPDFFERYVEGNKDGNEKPKLKLKPGALWGVVDGEECKISKHPHSGRMEYFTHGDWHELPSGIEVHKA